MPLRFPVFMSVVALALLAAPQITRAAQQPANPDVSQAAALAASKAAVGRRLGDFEFRDTMGRRTPLSRFRGRPVIINLIYTACTDFCPTIVQNLAYAVEGAQDALGADSFTVLTIGFDTRQDHPAQMRAYAKAQGIDHPNWLFLAADAPTILALTEQLGFAFYRAPQGFDHLAQTTIVGGDGSVYRQVYGSDLSVASIVEPLKQLRYGETASLASFGNIVERIKLFCTLYDPNEDAYRFDWSFFTGIFVGLLSLAGLTAFLVHAILQRRNFVR